jgi:hypothetical protein
LAETIDDFSLRIIRPKGKKLKISYKSGKDTNSGSEFLKETL